MLLRMKHVGHWLRGQLLGIHSHLKTNEQFLRIIAISWLKSTGSWQLMSVFAIRDDHEMTRPSVQTLTIWAVSEYLQVPPRPAPVSAQFASWLCRQKHLPGLRATSLRADPVFSLGFALFIHHNFCHSQNVYFNVQISAKNISYSAKIKAN